MQNLDYLYLTRRTEINYNKLFLTCPKIVEFFNFKCNMLKAACFLFVLLFLLFLFCFVLFSRIDFIVNFQLNSLALTMSTDGLVKMFTDCKSPKRLHE